MIITVLAVAKVLICKLSTATFTCEAAEKLNYSLLTGKEETAEAAETLYQITGLSSDKVMSQSNSDKP